MKIKTSVIISALGCTIGFLLGTFSNSNTNEAKQLSKSQDNISIRNFSQEQEIQTLKQKLEDAYFEGTRKYAHKFATDFGLKDICVVFKDKQSEKTIKYIVSMDSQVVSTENRNGYPVLIFEEKPYARPATKCNEDLEAPKYKVYNFEISREINRVY